ncbi:MAG TPA: hypothetical protein VJR70_12120, partial [Stellaceae bacterium]|nr:hypothetical protein [Stellaceae bacterium]
MTDLLRWGSPYFPITGLWSADDRFAWIRRLNGNGLALGTAAVSLAVSGFLAVGYVRYERLATAQDAAVRHAETANADLQEALARLRDQLGAAKQTLTATQNQIGALSDEAHRQITVSEQAASSKSDRITQLAHALEQAQRDLRLAEVQRVTLMARLSKSELDAADGRARQLQAQSGIEQWQKKVQELTADRDQLKARLSKLEQKLSQRQQKAEPERRVAVVIP